MKITFKETNSCITYETNGDINISPKYINKFGYIEGTDLKTKEFVFGGKGVATAIKIEGMPICDTLYTCPHCGSNNITWTGYQKFCIDCGKLIKEEKKC